MLDKQLNATLNQVAAPHLALALWCTEAPDELAARLFIWRSPGISHIPFCVFCRCGGIVRFSSIGSDRNRVVTA